jgi:hypothetical protein
MASVLKSRKGQAGLPMNYTVIGVIVVLVLAGVFYAIIKSEAVRKLRELPLQEEEVEEMVEVSQGCPVEVGYVKEENGLKYFYLKGTVERTNFYISEHSGWGSLIDEYSWVEGTFIWLDKDWGSDQEIGFMETVGGQDFFRVYCDRAPSINELIPVPKILDILNNAYFVGGFATGGKVRVCKQNTTQYDLDSCVDGKRFKKQIEKRLVDSYLVSLKRGNSEIVRIKPACLDKLNFKRNIIFEVAQTYSLTLEQFTNEKEKTDSEMFKTKQDFLKTRDVTPFKVFFEFVWDDCQKANFAILSLWRSPLVFPWENFKFEEWNSNIYKGKKSTTPAEMESLLFYTKQCNNEFLKNASEVSKNASTKESFMPELLKFLDFFCKLTPMATKGECIFGCKEELDKKFVGFELLKQTGCSEFREMVNKKSYIENDMQYRLISDASCSQCDSENGYECRIEKDGKLGDWEKCKIVGEKFCSKADDTKCVEYKWNDKLEFMSWAKQKYTLQLTKAGLKSV